MAYVPEGGKASTGNNTTANLSASATYTGTAELNPLPDVMVSCKADVAGTLYFDFSNDGTNWDTFPTQGFSVDADIHEFHIAVKGPRYFRARYVNGTSSQSSFRLYTYFGEFRKPNAPFNQSLGLDTDSIAVRGTITQEEIVRGLRGGVSAWNKFGYRDTTAAASGDQTLWADNSNLTIMTSSDTFDIAYNNATDGAGGGATGATTLLVDYIDANFELQQATHVMGSTGTDTTSFSGLGINRVVVVASGSNDANVNNITFTDTSGGTTQAIVPAGESVTQQLVFHLPIGYTGVLKYIRLSTNKLSGANPKVTFKVWVYNRLVDTSYQIRRYVIDTQSSTTIVDGDPTGISLSGRDVVYITMDTDQNNTVAQGSFSLNIYETV